VHNTGKQTKERFRIKHLPSFLYIHQGKMYRYPRSPAYSWQELWVFCQNPTATTAEDIPAPPDLLDWIMAKLAQHPRLLSGVMVMIMVLGAFIGAVVEHFFPPQEKKKKQIPPPRPQLHDNDGDDHKIKAE
jgi:hypothetical protein